ncbi:permease [Sulfobacillus thermotolerans]|uniref:Permease n=1 Tax=Sulfobacillus thermotolerans TaxID=338644 RepID=A0ABN5H4Z7_9FIRM|nr:permease [Sulfobacillus thermotolerans]
MSLHTGAVSKHRSAPWPVWPVIIFVILGVSLVYIAKWNPYYHKVFSVATHHTLGASVITGSAPFAPAPSWHAAWDYTWSYFKDIWIALIAGLVIGSGVDALLPPDWLAVTLGRISWKSRTLAGLAAIPSMMCTCCSAPIVVNLKRQKVSTGAVLAYWIGNPILNPATIIFMGFVLGWNWALLRIGLGIVLVALVAKLGDMWQPAGLDETTLPVPQRPSDSPLHIVTRFIHSLWKLMTRLLPEYIVLVMALGAARAWLFPAMTANLSHAWWLWILYAIVGTLFVIPTAGEVPIVSVLMRYGLGVGPAAVLMITLPAISLPSMAMVSTALPKSLLAKLAATVAIFGLITGLIGHFLL